MRISLFLTILVLLIPLCLVVPSAKADDGWWCASGGMERYGKGHPTIRMAREILKIEFLSDRPAAYSSKRWFKNMLGPVKVGVLFTFHNDGPETTVTMAFPENYDMRTGQSLEHFRSWVNGQRVSVRRKVTKAGDPKVADDEFADTEGSAVWLKKVHFKAHETVNVRVSYDGYMSGNTSGGRHFSYVLTTGASWKGPIGQCQIEITWPKSWTFGHPYFTQAPFSWTPVTHFDWTTVPGWLDLGYCHVYGTVENWKPDRDLEFDLHKQFGYFWLNGEQMPSVAGRFCGLPFLGTKTDPMIPVDAIERFFQESAKSSSTDWGPRPKQWFGGPFEVLAKGIKLSSGKIVPLLRPRKAIRVHLVEQPEFSEVCDYVYLKDLITALGGETSTEPGDDRFQIYFRSGTASP